MIPHGRRRYRSSFVFPNPEISSPRFRNREGRPPFRRRLKGMGRRSSVTRDRLNRRQIPDTPHPRARDIRPSVEADRTIENTFDLRLRVQMEFFRPERGEGPRAFLPRKCRALPVRYADRTIDYDTPIHCHSSDTPTRTFSLKSRCATSLPA